MRSVCSGFGIGCHECIMKAFVRIGPCVKCVALNLR